MTDQSGRTGDPVTDKTLFHRIQLPPEPERQVRAEALPGVRTLVRRMSWMLVGAVIGMVAGGVATLVRPPLYVSTAYLSVSSTDRDARAEEAARTAQALARVATAESVVSQPLREAGLTDAASRPRLSITAQAAPDAPLFSVTGIDHDPDRARQIAEVVVAAVTGLDDLGSYRAVLVAGPSVAGAPVTPRWLPPMGGALLGFGLAVVLATTVPPGLSAGWARRGRRPALPVRPAGH